MPLFWIISTYQQHYEFPAADKRGHIVSIGILKGSLAKWCHTLNSDYD